ncbi:MAG: porin family protein [Candidatus Kapabacteria bacterium]|nr:porin family protein [Candidatus Kapabacteria bacterium]
MRNNLFLGLLFIVIGTTTLFGQGAAEEPRTGGEDQTAPPARSEEALIARIKQNKLNWFVGADFLVGNPQSDLRRAFDSIGAEGSGLGFNLMAGYYFDPLPVAVTVDLGMAFQAGDNQRRTFQSGLFRDTIDIHSSTTMIPVNIAVRFMPNIGTWVFPYIEGVAGFTSYSSDFSVTQRRFEEVRSQSDDRNDVGWTYGVGAGVSVKTADFVNLPNALQRMLVDIRLRYLYGSSVEVSNVEPKINETDPMNSTYVFRSATVSNSDNVFFSLGLTIQF